MYKNNFVVALKYNGEILREQKDEVILPFGSEYSILLKNLNNKKAAVDVYIDGESALRDGRRILLSSGEEIELEGFKENSEVKHKFKFIEKIDEIKKHRGDKAEDGLVRVEVQYEKDYPWTTDWIKHISDYPWTTDWINHNMKLSDHPTQYFSNWQYISCLSSSGYDNSRAINYNSHNDEGITVEGSDTRQKFMSGHIGTLEEEKTIICLKLKGKENQTVFEIPVLVNKKIECKYCGRSNSSKFKFCPTCGAKVIV